jgi:mannosyltransferase OCH1-like enzyme
LAPPFSKVEKVDFLKVNIYMSIPKNIFQTHKSLDYLRKRPKLLNAIKSWRTRGSGFNYYFYDNAMCDNFIKSHFDEKINKAYFLLPMGVMKADLWRYCILYKYGGIYADVDTVCRVNPNVFINNSYLTVAPEPGCNYFCQWTFAAPAGSPILKEIIDLSVERILSTPIKGEHIIHYLTGPACFSDAIVKYLNENGLPTFQEAGQYHNYPSRLLAVFNRDNFHKFFVTHLYAGDDKDGWKNEKKRVLM